jgi:hypothetical protein
MMSTATMRPGDVLLSEQRNISAERIIALYAANGWSAARKPQELWNALRNSHPLVSACVGEDLIGLGNASSDGYLVVYSLEDKKRWVRGIGLRRNNDSRFFVRHGRTSGPGLWRKRLTSTRIPRAFFCSTCPANNVSSALNSSSVIEEVASPIDANDPSALIPKNLEQLVFMLLRGLFDCLLHFDHPFGART